METIIYAFIILVAGWFWIAVWIFIGLIVFVNAKLNRQYSDQTSFLCAIATIVLGTFTALGGAIWLLIYSSMMPQLQGQLFEATE